MMHAKVGIELYNNTRTAQHENTHNVRRELYE